MRSKSIFNLLFVVIIATSIVISLPVISFASTQAVNDAAANTKLTNIYNRLGNIYDRIGATNAYLGNIQSYTQNTQTYLQYIYGQLGAHTGYSGDIFMQVIGVQDLVQAVGGQVADVSSKLVYTNNYLSSIDSKSVNYTQYIDGIESSITNIDSINWVDSGINSINSLSTNFNQSNPISANNSNVLNAGTYYFRLPALSYAQAHIDTNVFRIDLPLRSNATYYLGSFIDSVKVLDPAGNEIKSPYTLTINYLNDSEYYVSIYFYDLTMIFSSQLSLEIKFNTTWIYRSLPRNIYYIPNNTNDYYFVSYLLNLSNMQQDINDLKEVYASDDVIAAKESQQAYEDQTINDFTGSGSAAASGSDSTNMKNVSGAIKSGLDSGGTVNGALGVFNTSGGLWDWFSQDNYNEINGTNTRSRNRSNEVYIDFYNTNREELEELLGEYR